MHVVFKEGNKCVIKMVSRNIHSTFVNGDKIPVITPILDTSFACLRYDPLPKVMKKAKPPSWFYASHNSNSVMLPQLQSPTFVRTSEMRAEMENLDRIHEWLRSSQRPAVAKSRSPPIPVHINNSNTNKNNSNSALKGRSTDSQGMQISSAPLPKLKTKDKTIMESFDPNFNSKFPKLGSIMTVSDEPEIIGRKVSVNARNNDWRKKKTDSLASDKNQTGSMLDNNEFYPTKILPREITASEYEKKRTRTFYGLDSSFSATNTGNHPLKRQVGPIQRPHSPVADLFMRQQTRYGDTMMHAKSPSKAFMEQQGKTYTLHAKLKDMLLER